MNFKELREANLSKAQIKKVHDKADDLPKNDFIKRYGKEGDAVRFATATNIVKKKLGMDEESRGVGTSRGRQSGVGYPSPAGSDSRARTKTIPSGPELRNPKSRLQKLFSDLDKEDEKSVGRVVKGLKKAVKAHQGQVDALTKDIKDEVEEGFKNDAQRQAAVASLYSKLGLKGASKRSREKDKGKKKEEVEITEAISDAQVDQIARMTDRNDHFGVRIEIARLMKDKQLMSFYDSLEKMHMTSQIQNAIGNDAVSLRGKLEKVLKVRMKQRFGDKDSKRIMDAL